MSEEKLNNINIPSWYTPAIDEIQNHINEIIEFENAEFRNKHNINIPAITFLRKDNFIENGEFNDGKFNELFDGIVNNLPENFEYSRKNYSIEKIKNDIKNDLIGVTGGRTHHFYLENKNDGTNVDISFCIACPYTDPINTKQTAIHELTHGIQKASGTIDRKYEIESKSDNLMQDSEEYKDLVKKWSETEKEIKDNFASKPDKIEEEIKKTNRYFRQCMNKLRKKFDNMFIIDKYINKYIVESQADLCGNIFLMLKALQDNNPIEIENLKKQLLYDTQAKFFEDGYNAYSIQVELTRRMEENPKEFKNTFLDKDKQIDFRKIFNYTYELLQEKSKVYEDFLKNEKEKGNLIYDKEFQDRIKEDQLNPIGAEIEDKRKYDEGYLLELKGLFETANESILKNTKQIFASQTLNNLNQDVINLYQFLKYNFNLNTYKRKEIWDRVIEQSLNEEQKNIFLSDKKSDESEYLEKEIIIPKYNELIKEEKRKNPLFNYFEENGIAPEDRFLPIWFDSVFNFWKETMDKSPSLLKYKISPTMIIDGTKANGDEIDWENFFSFVETIDKNEKDYIINSFKETNTYINKDQKGSFCSTIPIKNQENTGFIPIRSIYLNPYYSPVTTLQTMWHETTHWMQAIDNSNLDEKFEIIEQEKEIEAREKYLNEHKLSYTNDEYRDEIAKLNNDKKNLKNKNIKNKLPNEIQANLNGSMITFIQAIINNCNNLEYVERELIRTTDCDPYGGYCDFLITTENLKKLKTDKNFFNIFVNNGSINFDILDSYTSKVAQKLADEIIEFIERDGRMYIDALEDEALMSNENNPIFKMKQKMQEYWSNNPESELENLQRELHCFKKTKDFDHYNYIIHKISLQSLNLANEGLREEKNMNLSVERS